MRSSLPARSLTVTLCCALALPTTVVARAATAAPPPAAPADTAAADPSTMTPEQKLARAKTLFGEGTAALKGNDGATALTKFEEAYNVYAPDKHKFNFNIGAAAHMVGDCVKAKQAYQRFLDLVPEDPNRGEAQAKILEIDRSGCANAQPATTTTPATTPTPGETGDDESEDAPILKGRKEERDQKIDQELDAAAAKKKSPLLITGAALTALGGAGVIGGAVSIALANKKANDLAGLASPGPTGFPSGNYASQDVFDLDRNRLPRNNTATIVLFSVGGAALITGVALLAIAIKQKKAAQRAVETNDSGAESPPEEARASHRPRLVGIGPTALPRGAGAGATFRF